MWLVACPSKNLFSAVFSILDRVVSVIQVRSVWSLYLSLMRGHRVFIFGKGVIVLEHHMIVLRSFRLAIFASILTISEFLLTIEAIGFVRLVYNSLLS